MALVGVIYFIVIALLCMFESISVLKHPMTLLSTGFVLTGCVGNYLREQIQKRTWDYQFKKERLNHWIKEARIAFESSSRLMDI